ncbi:HAMP domain-containing sensor histidine kinase [Candidatus Stoquefichus massiliensis]|uniref:HAMP domain-containing sensor histidine kinase n=1 Tax=Candidatus Stoquefichus massiliensis TaxID=1470350 RepID=UPI00048662CF|nr:HAMP domain-containing sensor histidine kinase [Candidatus Stoquefichus massiliensis]
MRHRISVKIFVVLMSAFLIILAISMNLNITAQKNLYCQWIRETYKYEEVIDEVTHLFKEYQIYDIEDKEKVLKVIHEDSFQEKLRHMSDGYQNYIFITHNTGQEEVIDSYTLGEKYLNDYIVIYNGDNDEHDTISIASLSEETKANLLLARKNGMYTNTYNDYSDIYIKYIIEDNKFKYFEYQANKETFVEVGNYTKLSQQEKEEMKEGIITRFCIQNECYTYNPLQQVPITFQVEDMKEFLTSPVFYRSGIGGYVSYFEDVGNQTYFTACFGITDQEPKFMVSIVNVVDDIHDYVIKRYIEENYQLYIIAFVLAAIISILFSYMITRPIKKVQKAALKIANQEFGEPLKVKSKDEIGSLANSINIMREQLNDTIKKLHEEINHVKELENLRKDFINQFTHEMKTPLGIINGYSELIEEAENEEEAKKYLDIINRETSRINQLIQSMLSLSRLEAGKVELQKEILDLEDLVTEIVDEYEILYMQKNIKIEILTEDKELYADKKLISTIIHNFLSNAIKHTLENGKIIITICQGVSIYNEGEIIPEDNIESIWYTFVTHDHEGSGLGLAICRSILELHQFEYGVKNKENGVEFYFMSK